MVRAPHPVRRYYQHLTRLSAAFALSTDVAMMTLGGSLKRRETLSARLGDVLSQLYLASATLKRFEDEGHPKEDRPLLHWACQQSLYQIQLAFDGLFRNLPNRPVAWLLRLMLFPLGRHFRPPSDRLGHQVASLMLSPSPARDRLTDGIFLPTSLDEPLGRIEDALPKVIAAEPVERKLREALKDYQTDYRGLEGLLATALEQRIITEQEAEQVRAAEAARNEVIRVDDLAPDLGP